MYYSIMFILKCDSLSYNQQMLEWLLLGCNLASNLKRFCACRLLTFLFISSNNLPSCASLLNLAPSLIAKSGMVLVETLLANSGRSFLLIV